ncbi:winged helix-turn-helix domain-containing protein [Providencia rettgeri]|nr:winged helix-turn-helix domain-containing protein [Providencia rettgeri]
MKYKLNALIFYDAVDGTLSLKKDEVDTQLSITANALLYYFMQNRGGVRDDVLKSVWDDNGLVSSNSNLNQYLSILRKAFRQYGIENIIVTIARGRLELNSEVSVEILDEETLQPSFTILEEPIISQSIPRIAVTHDAITEPILSPERKEICWYLASSVFILFAILIGVMTYFSQQSSTPISLTPLQHNACDVLSNESMINASVAVNYRQNFDKVTDKLTLAFADKERFVFFYGDKLQTNGLGRVFLAHCAVNEDNPFSYCDNYFYYSWKPS